MLGSFRDGRQPAVQPSAACFATSSSLRGVPSGFAGSKTKRVLKLTITAMSRANPASWYRRWSRRLLYELAHIVASARHKSREKSTDNSPLALRGATHRHVFPIECDIDAQCSARDPPPTRKCQASAAMV